MHNKSAKTIAEQKLNQQKFLIENFTMDFSVLKFIFHQRIHEIKLTRALRKMLKIACKQSIYKSIYS